MGPLFIAIITTCISFRNEGDLRLYTVNLVTAVLH